MKFLCENCKAKYQIADDKVAGRTVRMKCRKCNHMIEVEASVTETSVSTSGPEEARPKPTAASSGVSGAKGAVQAVASGLPPPRPAPPPRPMNHSLAGVRPRPTPLPTGAPSSRPPGGKAAPKSPASGGAGLAGAFSKAVAAPSEDPSSVSAAMAVLSSSSSTEEWYVGINGVPVGPVRLSDVRRKASNGLITEESLVWREGFEEWVPLRTFPELAAIVKESATAGRTSLTPTPSAAGPPPSRTHAPLPRGPASPAGSGIRPSVTSRAVGVQTRSNVLAFAARGATAEKIEGLGEPSFEEHIKVDESGRPPPPASPEPAPVPAAPVLPEVFEPIQFRAAGFSTRVAQSRRAHPALWLVVALGGMLLGVGAMVVLLPKSNVKPAVQIVSVMVPTPAAPTVPSGENEGTATIGAIEVTAPATAGKGSGSKGGKAVSSEPAAPGAPAAPLSTSLTGLGGLVGGPSAPSGGGSSSSGGGGQLQTADLERVVQSHRAFVKRQCWDPALGARAPNAPSSARVVVAINVAPSGSVQSVNATGGDGYPGLSSCVQGQVKNWKFPQGDGTTTFNVPFVFAAQ